MSIIVAFGSLTRELPCWLKTAIPRKDIRAIETIVNPKRKRELLWSRGLKAGLQARMEEIDCNYNASAEGHVSIAHDHHIAIVGMSKYAGIGIDLQSDRPLESCSHIAETWFPELEREEILASGDTYRFLQSWVIKEAWAKYTRRSIFATCQSIGVWRGMIHVTGNLANVPNFAWSRQSSGIPDQFVSGVDLTNQQVTGPPSDTPGFAMGVCIGGEIARDTDIECLIPGSNAEFRPISVDWEWIPIGNQI